MGGHDGCAGALDAGGIDAETVTLVADPVAERELELRAGCVGVEWAGLAFRGGRARLPGHSKNLRLQPVSVVAPGTLARV